MSNVRLAAIRALYPEHYERLMQVDTWYYRSGDDNAWYIALEEFLDVCPKAGEWFEEAFVEAHNSENSSFEPEPGWLINDIKYYSEGGELFEEEPPHGTQPTI